MSIYRYRKTVVSPTDGVDLSVDPHLLKPSQWSNLNRMQCLNGRVSAFPGHARLESSGFGGTRVTLLREYRQKSGTVYLMGADDVDIVYFDTTTRTWTDISGATTFGPTRDYPWDGITYANAFYLTNKVDGLYKWTGVGNVSAIASSPKGWFINVLNNHICTFGDDANPFTFSWAAEGTETFVAADTNDAGSFDVLETSDHAAGLHYLDKSLIGYKRKSLHKFNYIGGKAVMGHDVMVPNIGLVGSAIAVFADSHIFMGDPPGFYEYTGGNTADPSIGFPIFETVFGEINFALKNRSRCLVLPNTYQILFFYPSVLSSTGCDRVVMYNRKDRTWAGPWYFGGSSASGLRCEVTGSAEIVLTTVIDNVSAIIDSVTDIIDLYGNTYSSGYQLVGDQAGRVLHIGGSMSDRSNLLTRECETGDLALGKECEDDNGQPMSFPLNSVFQVHQINIMLGDIGAQGIQMYVGSKMNLNEVIVWDSAKTIYSDGDQTLEVPVRPRPGRWHRLKFVLPDSKDMALLGYQILFSHSGVR